MYETYFARKIVDYVRARERARLGCAWGGTYKRFFFVQARPKKAVLGPIFGSAREVQEKPRTADDKQPFF